MKNRIPIDFLLILIMYLICAGLIYGAVAGDWLGQLGVQTGLDPETQKPMTAERFGELYEFWGGVIAGVSLLCAFVWYVLGEWGPRANKLSSMAWLFIWLALLVVAIAMGVLAVFIGPAATDNSWILIFSYLLWGAGFFYVATLLFSPVNTKYVVPGSSSVRRGW